MLAGEGTVANITQVEIHSVLLKSGDIVVGVVWVGAYPGHSGETVDEYAFCTGAGEEKGLHVRL